METKAAVDGCGSNKGCGVGLSHNEVKANNMCAQDLLNARGVNAPVAGSLRVRQLYGDKDVRQKTVYKVGMNSGPTSNNEQEVAMKRNQLGVDGIRQVDMRDGEAKSKLNVSCCVKCQNQRTKDSSSNNTTNSEG